MKRKQPRFKPKTSYKQTAKRKPSQSKKYLFWFSSMQFTQPASQSVHESRYVSLFSGALSSPLALTS